MTSRDRVLSSIEHRQPDRIPIDLGASTVTGISAIGYNRLKGKLGMDLPTRIFDVVQQLAFVDDPLIDAFGVDALDLNRVLMDDMEWYPVTLSDGSSGLFPSWYAQRRYHRYLQNVPPRVTRATAPSKSLSFW